jgi:superoxide dismutase, Cu-Zn family
VLLALPLAGCAALGPPAASGARATADLRDAHGARVGVARLVEVRGGVRIVLELRGMSPGPKAVHLHVVGRCDPPDFASAGGHFNPLGHAHGLLHPAGPHAGDLPNVTVAEDGAGRLETLNPRVTLAPGPTSLLDADGTALVVHAGPDDFLTDPEGGSGPRIACGVVRPGPPEDLPPA